MQKSVRITGKVSLIILLIFFIPALHYQCSISAAIVGGSSIVAGALLGVCMAAITRTKNPTVIYILLAMCVSMLWLYIELPSPALYYFHTIPFEKQMSAYSYLEILRPVLYIVAIIFPYAAIGQHAADPLAPGYAQLNDNHNHNHNDNDNDEEDVIEKSGPGSAADNLGDSKSKTGS